MKKEELPIYRYLYDEENDETFSMIAYTSNPAIQSKGYLFNNNNNNNKIFSDDEKQEIIAPLIIPDVEMTPRKDYIKKEDGTYENIWHIPIFTNEDIDKMYRVFMRKLKSTYVFNIEHKGDAVPSYFFEIWRKEFDDNDKSIGYGLNHPIGTIYMKSYIADKDLYNKMKESKTSGLSIEGLLTTKKMSDEQSIIDILNNLDENTLNKLTKYINKS